MIPDATLDPTIALLDGVCTTTTCLNNVDTGNSGDTETLSFTGAQGTTCMIVVDGFSTSQGFFKIAIR